MAVSSPPYRTADVPSLTERFWEADASDERKEIFARRMAELTPEVLAGLSPGELWERRYAASAAKIWFDPDYDGSWLWEDVVMDGAAFQRVAGELLKPYDLAQVAGEIAVPVLVVHGRYDYWESHTLWEGRVDKLARHTFVLFEQSAHCPPLEEPERFDETLLDWVRSL